ncbi:MAG TPA: SDR family oxidoreductase [Roseiflexaceae bacterium]|nr:SDR family oxidoreductase [Roseiflexaceae bacterium]
MKLAIFGGSGRTGRHLIEQALAAGHHVTALARTIAKMPVHERLTVVQGDVQDPSAVERTIAGAEAVISVLGPTSNEPKFEISRGMQHILAAMQKHGVRRLIVSAGAGVGDPNDTPQLFNKAINLLIKRLSRNVYEDMVRVVEIVRASDRDWTVVRVPRLLDGPRTGNVKVGYVGKGIGPTINRADMADFMLRQLESDAYVRKAPAISN